MYQIPVVRIALVREGAVSTKARTIGGPKDAAAVLREIIGDRDRETFAVLMLNTKHRVIAAHIASIGALDRSLAEPREVFRAAVLAGAKAIVLGHNHPSGDLEPSPADLKITDRLAKAGDLLGIPVVDHLIVGLEGYVSIAERGGLKDASDLPTPSFPPAGALHAPNLGARSRARRSTVRQGSAAKQPRS